MTNGAIQRAISSPNILVEIFSQLSPGWNDFQDPDNADYEDERKYRVSLRSAGECLDNVIVLLKILPHTLSDPDDDSDSEFDEDMNPAQLDILNPSTEIDDSAWTSFRKFARRVRELNACPPDYFVHHDVWITLATRLQGAPLLPVLQRLQILMKYNDPASFVLCLSPTLRQLGFSFCDDEGEPMLTNGQFVQNIVTAISAIQEQPLSSYRQLAPPAPECTDAVGQHLRSIGRLSNLEVLNLVPTASHIKFSPLRGISTLPSLHTLRLVVPLKDEDKDDPLSLEGLTTVRRLHLSGEVEGIRRVMSAIPPSGLRRLYFRISASQSKETESAFGAIIAQELESFECVFFGPIAEGPRPTLRPFNAFQVLELEVLCSRYDDGERRAPLRRRPPRVRLELAQPRAVRDGLIDLARSCSRLHLIRVPSLDFGTMPPANTVPEQGHARLRYLDPHMLFDDRKANLDEVARVLDHLFSDLVDVPQKYIEYNATENSVSWDKMQGLMRARRASCRLERGGDNGHGSRSH